MSKKLKNMIVQDLNRRFQDVDEAVLLDYGGLAAEESLAFRKTLRDAGVSLNVVKNTLARRVFADRGVEVPSDWFQGPVAIAIGAENAVTVSKVVDGWRKENKKEVKLRGGLLGGQPLSADEAEKLTKMPSIEELHGMIVSLIAGPLTGTVSILNNTLASMPNVVQAIADKRKEEGE